MKKRIGQINGLSRKKRLIRQKQLFSKKITIGILVISSALLIGGGIYTSYATQHNTNNKIASTSNKQSYEQQEQKLLKKIKQKKDTIESIEQKKTIKKSQMFTYEPVTSKSKPYLSILKDELNTLMKTAQKTTTKQTSIKIVGYVATEKIHERITKYQPTVETYTWDMTKKEWLVTTITSDHPTFINHNNNHEVSLRDIFVNEGNILAVQQVVQQKLLAESSDSAKIIDSVLNMPTFSLDTTAFIYNQDQITLTLPENIAEKKEIVLPYKEIANYVNPEYVNPSSIEQALSTPLDPNKKYISLTFDDGPNPETTPKLLEILKEKESTATFFMLGQNVEKNTALAKRIKDEGHEIASHSYSHPQLTSIDAQQVKEEVQKTDKAIFQATGELPLYFRPPYGAINKEVAEITRKPIIQWTVDSDDWKSHDPEAIVKQITDTAYNDTIVLMHDIHQETVHAVPVIIDRLREEGYEIIPIAELLEKKAKPLHMYYSAKDERLIQ